MPVMASDGNITLVDGDATPPRKGKNSNVGRAPKTRNTRDHPPAPPEEEADKQPVQTLMNLFGKKAEAADRAAGSAASSAAGSASGSAAGSASGSAEGSEAGSEAGSDRASSPAPLLQRGHDRCCC